MQENLKKKEAARIISRSARSGLQFPVGRCMCRCLRLLVCHCLCLLVCHSIPRHPLKSWYWYHCLPGFIETWRRSRSSDTAARKLTRRMARYCICPCKAVSTLRRWDMRTCWVELVPPPLFIVPRSSNILLLRFLDLHYYSTKNVVPEVTQLLAICSVQSAFQIDVLQGFGIGGQCCKRFESAKDNSSSSSTGDQVLFWCLLEIIGLVST